MGEGNPSLFKRISSLLSNSLKAKFKGRKDELIMVTCPTCNQETESGKFCTKCGASLDEIPNQTPSPASKAQHTQTPNQEPAVTSETSQQQPAQSNETVEKMKESLGNYGNFFVRLIKSPSEAKNVDQKDWISGVITLVAFALIISIFSYASASSIPFYQPDFFEQFLKPFALLLLLLAVSIGLTYGGYKLTGINGHFLDVVAKMGGYLIPFPIIALLGIILSVIGIEFALFLVHISLIAPIVLIPIFILFEKPTKPANGFDKVYVITGIVFITSVLAYYFIFNTLMNFGTSILDQMF